MPANALSRIIAVLCLIALAHLPAAAQTDPAPDWTPVIETFDGVTMALVPAGCFTMGSDNGAPNEEPAHEVCIDADFWIDVTEVTHEQFSAFGGSAGRVAAFDTIGADLPRERVTWFEASDFCALRGGALPTEAQWEYAARGALARLYPWGDEWMAGAAIAALGAGGHPEAVGARPDDASWVGAHDLAGNVFEWTRSLFAPYPYQDDDGRNLPGQPDRPRVIRGGGWSYNADWVRTSARGVRPPTTETAEIGFRCVRAA